MIKLPVKYDADAHEILDADGRWCTTREDAEEMAVALNAHTELSTRLAEYEEMLGEAVKVRIDYADHDEAYIVSYPLKRGLTILHYRDREGDWINDRTVDTDFTGNRKWKGFDSPLDAWKALKQESGNVG